MAKINPAIRDVPPEIRDARKNMVLQLNMGKGLTKKESLSPKIFTDPDNKALLQVATGIEEALREANHKLIHREQTGATVIREKTAELGAKKVELEHVKEAQAELTKDSTLRGPRPPGGPVGG
jgi:hypothetical protein